MLWHDGLDINVGFGLRFGLFLLHRLVYALSLLLLDLNLLAESGHVPVENLLIDKVRSPADII